MADSGRNAATWSVAGILIARRALYIPVDLIGGLDSTFAQLDLALYSPLCVALGLGAAIVARGPRPSQERSLRWSAEPHGQVAEP